MRSGLVVAAAALAAIGLGACSTETTDSVNWVTNPQEKTYVEVPKSFKRFTVDPYRVNRFDAEAERVAGLKRSPNGWSVVFDSAKKPEVAHFDDPRPSALVGNVSVYRLQDDWTRGPNFRDGINAAMLRSYPIGSSGAVDPIAAFNDGDPDIEIVAYREVAENNGIRGAHIRFNQQIGPSQWVTIDQQAFTNRETNKLYILTLKCSSTCFKAAYATAKKISSSFTVQK